MTSRQTISLLQVGQGRIGSLLKRSLDSHSTQAIHLSRLDPPLGLTGLSEPTGYLIENLIICIAPSRKLSVTNKIEFWQNVFVGLQQQVKSGYLVIRRIFFVSSTRVYDAIQSGIIEASTRVQSDSDMGQALIDAEFMLSKLTLQCHCFRAAGLVGQKYPKYQQYLRLQDNKLRFAIIDWQLVELITEQVISLQQTSLQKNQKTCYYYLATDGEGYFNGKIISLQSWQKQTFYSALNQRWLKSSVAMIE